MGRAGYDFQSPDNEKPRLERGTEPCPRKSYSSTRPCSRASSTPWCARRSSGLSTRCPTLQARLSTPRGTSVPADGGRPVGWESVEIILGCLWVPRGETRVIGRFPKNRKPWNKAKNSWLGLSCEVRMMMVVMVPSVSWA